jgi:hypothetical protein
LALNLEIGKMAADHNMSHYAEERPPPYGRMYPDLDELPCAKPNLAQKTAPVPRDPQSWLVPTALPKYIPGRVPSPTLAAEQIVLSPLPKSTDQTQTRNTEHNPSQASRSLYLERTNDRLQAWEMVSATAETSSIAELTEPRPVYADPLQDPQIQEQYGITIADTDHVMPATFPIRDCYGAVVEEVSTPPETSVTAASRLTAVGAFVKSFGKSAYPSPQQLLDSTPTPSARLTIVLKFKIPIVEWPRYELDPTDIGTLEQLYEQRNNFPDLLQQMWLCGWRPSHLLAIFQDHLLVYRPAADDIGTSWNCLKRLGFDNQHVRVRSLWIDRSFFTLAKISLRHLVQDVGVSLNDLLQCKLRPEELAQLTSSADLPHPLPYLVVVMHMTSQQFLEFRYPQKMWGCCLGVDRKILEMVRFFRSPAVLVTLFTKQNWTIEGLVAYNGVAEQDIRSFCDTFFCILSPADRNKMFTPAAPAAAASRVIRPSPTLAWDEISSPGYRATNRMGNPHRATPIHPGMQRGIMHHPGPMYR